MSYRIFKLKTIFIVATFFLFTGCVSTKYSVEGFEKIIFNSTLCFGTCPSLYLEVTADKNTKVQRQFFESRGKENAENSGAFEGKMSNYDFKNLMKTIKESNYEKLVFPNVDCCDAPIITIIIYANGKKTYLKSMMPPQEATNLIQYLTKLTSEIDLPTSTKKFELVQ
ncbi:MAG: DUF6438 domain-containing protein [Chitinophagales bacterium]|nr:DUF6438 domain-containing protein [Chitinophagales bacterium]